MAKRLICLFFLILLGSFTFANGGSEQEQLSEKKIPTIRFAYSWAYGFTGLLEQYKDRVKDHIRIEQEPNVGLQHKENILIDVASNNLPDIFTFWSYETNLGDFVKNDHIIDIQEYFDASKLIDRNNFYESSLKATEINGVNYAIPHERFFGFFVVNKEIFKSLNLPYPKTWEDIKKISPILLENDIIPISMGSFKGDPGHLFFSALTYQSPNGYDETLEMKNSNNFIYPGTINATKAVLDLIKCNAIPNNTIYSGSWDHQINEYNNRRTAMIYTFSWNLALFRPEIADNSLIIPVPRINKDVRDVTGFTVGGIALSICINKKSWNDSDKQNEIIQIVDWLLSEEVFITRLNQQGTFPTLKMDIPEFKNSMYYKVEEYIKTVEIFGIHEFYFNSLNAFNQFKEANDLLWSGVFSKHDFLNFVQEGININNE